MTEQLWSDAGDLHLWSAWELHQCM